MNGLGAKVLKLNNRWIPIGVVSATQAFKDLSAYEEPYQALRWIEGYPVKMSLSEWLALEPSEDDTTIGVPGHGGELIRKIPIPRVIIAENYDGFHTKDQPCTPDNLLKRYGHKDAVTGKPLSRENFSREHVQPRSKGGKNGWGNEVPMDRRLNSKRGNKSYRKAGLKKPKIKGAPPPLLPVNTIVNEHGYPEWRFFGIRDS